MSHLILHFTVNLILENLNSRLNLKNIIKDTEVHSVTVYQIQQNLKLFETVTTF